LRIFEYLPDAKASQALVWRRSTARSRTVAGAGTLIAEFCDIQSGRDDSRAELQRAIQLAKRENAKIVIARLDRFSRRVSFTASILEQGIGLVCAEMPNATDFQLHIFAALAQEERRLISERTKAALAEAKRRGKILDSNGRYLATKNCKTADAFASQLRANLDADLLRCSYSEIVAVAIAERRGGGRCHQQGVPSPRRALRIAALTFRFLLGFWQPAPYTDHVDHEEDHVLNDERRLGFQPPVYHPGDRGNDEDNEARNGDTRVEVGSHERSGDNRCDSRKRS
jgi:DNA invertase Pin-like site-specific DNA recombinase